jgi:hypothetical protein
MPITIGCLSGFVGLRVALALIVVAGAVISLAARTVMEEAAYEETAGPSTGFPRISCRDPWL